MEWTFKVTELERMWICGTCAGLNGIPVGRDAPPVEQIQRCRCRSTDEPAWPSFNFNEHVHLCECCLMEALPSGSRFSVWFCEECRLRVIALNDRLRVWLIPIGRHSIMVSTYEPPGLVMLSSDVFRMGEQEQATRIEHFRGGFMGMISSIDRLLAWSEAALLEDLRELGYPAGAEVRLSDFLRAARARAKEDPRFAKRGAFERLEKHMRAAR